MDRIKRLQWLKEKHREIHQKIEVCIAEKVSDDVVNKFKKEKLKYKDEIRKLEWNPDEYQGGVEMFGVYGLKPLGQK